ncbi:carbohydrate porin [Sphingomonas nostoxanthinifaciens]|uniref:carbohydrate porin n=1 Tax=Sphingomonas nostoxanthinifaciens TaxID=2872652 RepID=UPI001CC21669|nr:carbohydrate porin [Sphingomonas nostoxanthinifaciens]UAK25382.1 carbohydrate porin [Sphingomonas nostoxanthinifaciens]
MKRMVVAGALLALTAQGRALAQDAAPGAAGRQAPAGSQLDTQTQPDKSAPATTAAPEEEPLPSALTVDTRRPPPPGLIGDWRKIRTRLALRGIGLTARYASESAFNAAGGTRNVFRETGQFDAGALLDLDKLVGLKGGAFQATLTFRRGHNLSDDAHLGTLQQVQEVYGRGQTLRLTQFWYEQVVGDKLELKLGLTNPGEDFAAFSCQFMNLSFCGAQPGNLSGDYWANWPVSQLGARVRYSPDKTHYVQAAVYQVNPRNLDATGFYFVHTNGGTGVLVPVEAGWTPTLAHGRVASYKIGGWVSTAPADDLLLDVNHRPRVLTDATALQHSSRYGIYINVERQFTGRARDGKAASGLSVFANVTQTDRQTTLTDNQVAAGLFYRGLLPWLRGEVLGVAFARTNVNGRATRAQELDPTHPPVQHGAEYASEIFYSIQPLEGLELRPNVQYIHHPGGLDTVSDACILGLKAAVTL